MKLMLLDNFQGLTRSLIVFLLKQKEAIINTAVVAELAVLFFIGEIVGRGSLIGYDVSRVQPVFPLW
jgi:hypothetical protein